MSLVFLLKEPNLFQSLEENGRPGKAGITQCSSAKIAWFGDGRSQRDIGSVTDCVGLELEANSRFNSSHIKTKTS